VTARELPARATPVSPAEVYLALRLQLEAQLGREQVTRAGAMVLLGQMALETGRFKASMNYNLGGVKCGSNWSGCWQHFATTEHFSPAASAEYLAHVPEGAKVEHTGTDAKGLWILRFSGKHPMNRFRAYETLDVAMESHVRFLLGKRYRAAVFLAMDGKAGDYSRALRVAGYYSGDPDDYARNVSSLAKEYDRALPADAAPSVPVHEPLTMAASLPPVDARNERHEPSTPPVTPPPAMTVALPRVGDPLPVVALPWWLRLLRWLLRL
jgi:hypothetical protein